MIPRPTPTLGWAFLLVAIYLAVQSLFSTPILAWTVLTSGGLSLNLTLIGLVNSAAFVATTWIAVLLSRLPARALLAAGPCHLRLIPAILLLGLGTAIACSEIYNVTLTVLPMPEWFAQFFGRLLDVASNPVGAALALVVVAPVTEEFICRRWLLESLLQRWSGPKAIVVSAVIFGAMHLNPWQFVYATALGLGIGWFYARTRSLPLCIAWHALNNGLVVLANYWSPDIEGFRNPEPGVVEFHPAWLNLTALALIGVGIALTLWQTPRPAQPTPPLPTTPPGPPPLPPTLPGMS